MHFIRQDTIPSGCYQVRRQLEGSGASDVTVWDYLFSHLLGVESRQLIVPSWLSEQWRLLDFGPAAYGNSQTLTTGAGLLFNAASQQFQAWQRDSDYNLYPLTEEANPYFIQIDRPFGLGYEDYWYHGLRQFSDIVALDDETDATNAPEDLIMAAVKYKLGEMLFQSNQDPKWSMLMQGAAQVLAVQRQARGKARPKKTAYQRVSVGRGVGHVG
jgi:hypothetical protein